MKHWLTNLKFTTFSGIFLAFFVINTFVFNSKTFGAFLLLFFIALVVPPLGRITASQENKTSQITLGFFVLLSSIAVIGSLAYYFASFTAPVAIFMVLFAPPLVWLIWQKNPIAFKKPDRPHNPLGENKSILKFKTKTNTAIAVTLLTLASTLVLIIKSATENSIRSPWEVIPPVIFLIFGLSALLITTLLIQKKEATFFLPLIMIMLFVFISVALLVFPLGYGFDSFIHRATENHIAEFGTITPKPFYYIGQYALVLFFHFAFLIPIEWADKLLVPILTALFLPTAWLSAATHLLKEKKAAFRSLIILFFLPLTSFIVTTPQGLGNLWFLLLILLAIPRLIDQNNQPIWPLVLGALTTAVIHPIAGIPALLFVALLATKPNKQKQKNSTTAQVFSWIVILFGGFALPITFVVNNLRSGQGFGFDFSALSPLTLVHNLRLDLFFENRFSPILDFVYLFGWNQIILLVIGAIIGVFWLRMNTAQSVRTDTLNNYHIYLTMALVLIINFVVIKSAVNFSFLIDYERGNYADRLIPLIIFCLIPFLIIFSGRWFSALQEKPLILRASTAILLSALITSAFYLNYPRQDSYETNHGFNLGLVDITAVNEIEREANGKSYVVLANQTTSSAAIHEFGFNRYFDKQYFYPIPTGGSLYQLFLQMNASPSRETALTAMNLVGVDKIYYLISDYWWQAEKIREIAKTSANSWWSIENGKITIFEYER